MGDVAARFLFMDIVGRLLIQSGGLVGICQAERLNIAAVFLDHF